MAEERLIDTDKDKKYRIRKNADGEDELYIDDSADEEEIEEVAFRVSEEEEPEEEDNAFSTEGLEELRRLEEEERARREQKVNALIESARKDCAEYKYATAVDYLEKAAEIDPENGEIYALRLVAYTRDFTDYSRVQVAQEFCEEVEKYTAKQTKEEMFKRASSGLEDNIDKLTKRVAELDGENEKQKSQRAKKFVVDRNRAIAVFSIAFAALAVFVALAIYYFVNIFAVQGNTNMILAIVFSAVALLAFGFSAVALRKLLTASRRVRLNKRNSATKLGRELLAQEAELKAFTAIYKALKG